MVKTKSIKDAELSKIKIGPHNVDDVLKRITKDKEDPAFLIVDLFCGAGGTTTGFELAEILGRKVAKVIACVNHDSKAIESHWFNHPWVLHFLEDIRTLNLMPLIRIVNHYRQLYPNAVLILWASLECTNFSKAKGGLPRDADSRTLADHLFRYVEAINPDYVQIENVVEFMSWGPLIAKVVKSTDGYPCCNVQFIEDWEYVYNDEGELIMEAVYSDGECLDDEPIKRKTGGIKVLWQGVPESRKNGQDYMRWCREMCSYGYRDEWKELNSADFGAYTSRNRLFGCFAKPEFPICWPEATHSKKPSTGSLFGAALHKWKPVKDVLDFTDEGESIFARQKPLSEKTLERIYAGLVKYVAKGDRSFISKYFSGRPAGKVNSVNDPASTVTTFGNQSLVQTKFLSAYYGNGDNCSSVNSPCPTVPTKDRFNLVQPEFLLNYNHSSDHNDLNDPAPTLVTKDKLGFVKPQFFLDKQYSGERNHQSVDQPAGALLANPKLNLVEATPFIMPTNYDNTPKSIEEPCPTVLAGRKHHYIVNPSWGGNPGSVEEPCCVVVARQDKAPLYFVQVEQGPVKVAIYEGDTPCMIKIKQFMAAFGLVDIKMRMLRVNELLKIQGFPDNYVLAGNQSDQKKFIGNSVVPHVVKAWAEELAGKLIESKVKAA